MNLQRNIGADSIWHFTRLVFLTLTMLSPVTLAAQSEWVAPQSADTLTNPLTWNSDVKNAAKTLYTTHCQLCHGKKGDGKGIATSNDLTPADLGSSEVQQQSDGAIFWKISHGHDRMIGYKAVLTEDERWALVGYIRQL